MQAQRSFPKLPAGISLGDTITYTNGNRGLYTGKVMEIGQHSLILLDTDNEASVTLWNAGYAVGTQIYADQIQKIN